MNDSTPKRDDGDAPPGGADVIVVGGGLAGTIAAWRAARAGAETIVLDSAERPAAARVAAGMIAPVGEATWGEERMLGLASAAAELWPEFASDLAAESATEVPYRRCGAVHVALDPDEAGALRRRDLLLERAGLAHEALRGSAARRLEPALATAVVAATRAPGEAEVDPRALLVALREAARRAGARFHAATVAEISAGGVVRTDSGEELAAGRVLVAAGAWTGAAGLLPGGARLPVRPVKGEILRLRFEPGAQPVAGIVVGERFYLVPRQSGELILGATAEERGFDLRVTAGAVHELLREARRAVPELAELELVDASAGVRPGSPDNAPIFGWLEGGDGVGVVAGLYRNGVLLAPMLAAGLDAMLAGRGMPEQLAGLGPERFGRRREPVV